MQCNAIQLFEQTYASLEFTVDETIEMFGQSSKFSDIFRQREINGQQMFGQWRTYIDDSFKCLNAGENVPITGRNNLTSQRNVLIKKNVRKICHKSMVKGEMFGQLWMMFVYLEICSDSSGKDSDSLEHVRTL